MANETTGCRRFPGATTPAGSDDEQDANPEQDEAEGVGRRVKELWYAQRPISLRARC